MGNYIVHFIINILLKYINLFLQNLLHISHPHLLEIAPNLIAMWLIIKAICDINLKEIGLREQCFYTNLLYSKIFIMMDYIYLYNCFLIGQFYSDFKIAQASPLLVSGKTFRTMHSFSGLFGRCDNKI